MLEETAYTLNTLDRHAVAKVYASGSYGQYSEGPASTLRANGGDYGGGSESLAVQACAEKTGAITAGAHPGGFNGQDAYSGMLVLQGTYQAKAGTVCQCICKETSNQIASDGMLVSDGCVVRRLMPVECARLQGFPDWWCQGLGIPAPSEEDLSFWERVFAEKARIDGKKPRSRRQVAAWLKDPYSESAEYRLWGNGIALPCALYVMEGIAGVLEGGAE